MVFICGIDEAGRGPIIGPLVICGVLANEKQEKELVGMGVKDSKMLTPIKRERMFDRIKTIVEKYEIIVIEPAEIDSVVGKGKTVNLNWLEADKSAEIINKLKPNTAIIDCPSVNTKKYTEYLKQKVSGKVHIIAEHKADQTYPIVSAASILAKVTRDELIQEIKKKYNVEFGSLHFNEEVLIERNNKISIEKIGPLVEEGPWDFKVFSLNTRDYSIKKYPATAFIEHPKTDIFEVNLERGKNIKISKNHPLFCLDEDLNIVPKKLKDLNAGNYVAVAGGFNSDSELKFVDLLELLRGSSTKKSPLYAKINTSLIKDKEKLIRQELKKIGYTRTAYNAWLKSGYLPIEIYSKLNHDSNVKFCSREDKLQINRYFKIDKEFMWFLGIFIAEGWLSDYKVFVSNEDEKVINKIKAFANRYGINCFHNKKRGDIGMSSILLVKILKALVKGNSAYTKEVPEFVFSANKAMIKTFLDGLYEGDGYDKDGNWEIELRSEKIIKQLQWLNLMINTFSASRKRYTKPAFISHNMSKSTNSLSPDSIPAIVGKYIKKLREKNRITQSELAKKAGIRIETISAVENTVNDSVQKQIIMKIAKVLPDKILDKLLNANICWLKIKEMKFIEKDKVYDLGVAYRGVENFLGGNAGVILHNSGYPSDPMTQLFVQKNWNKYGFFRTSWETYKALVKGKAQTKLFKD